MTLEELLRRFRSLAKDTAEPFLWADDDVVDWLNDAQAQACIRGRLIREDDLAAVCRIALVPGQQTYPLSLKCARMFAGRALRPLSMTRRRRSLASAWNRRIATHRPRPPFGPIEGGGRSPQCLRVLQSSR